MTARNPAAGDDRANRVIAAALRDFAASTPRRRHPAEVTADRLGDALDKWPAYFDGADRDALARVRDVLYRISQDSPPKQVSRNTDQPARPATTDSETSHPDAPPGSSGWDWLVSGGGGEGLGWHALPAGSDPGPPGPATAPTPLHEGTAACGYRNQFHHGGGEAGIFAALWRCAACCTATGVPSGYGRPAAADRGRAVARPAGHPHGVHPAPRGTRATGGRIR